MNIDNIVTIFLNIKKKKNRVYLYCENDDVITIPDCVEIIEGDAFKGCNQLRIVKTSSNSKLRIIKEGAFYKSPSIESITLPSSLVEIEQGWRIELPKLNEIKVMSNNPIFTIYDDKILLRKSSIEKENCDVLVLSTKDIETVIIPDEIEIIENFS